MAQATYLTSPIGTLTTGVVAKQFINPILTAHDQSSPMLPGFLSRTFKISCEAVELENRDGLSKKRFASQSHETAIADDGRLA